MRPNEKNLERLVKKLVKQEQVIREELLFHWTGLGERGDRIVIQTLNKQNGWEPFLLWSESEPDVREKLKQISNRAGISEAGLLALKAAGVPGIDAESARTESLWILQIVRKGPSVEWDRAAQLLLRDPDFFEGTLSLLDLEESFETALFLAKVLELKPLREQDQAIRKSLYRLRQKGIEPPEPEKIAIDLEPSRTEYFFLAENRIPFWQPFFYYRSHGARGDWFFAEVREGKVFEIVQQQRDIRINEKSMQRVAENYSAEFKKGTGVDLRFHSIPAPHARYFLERSFEFITGAEDFRKYMGEASAENPTTGWNTTKNLVSTDAEKMFDHEYFSLWMVEEEFVTGILNKFEQIEKGTIILPEQQRRIQKAEILDQAMQDYFSQESLRVWSLILEKAAYYLRNQEPEIAELAFSFSGSLVDPEFQFRSDPFTNLLLERSIDMLEQRTAREEKEEKRSSLIMSPQEFERSLNTEAQRHREKKMK
jgi:hypothetical protein